MKSKPKHRRLKKEWPSNKRSCWNNVNQRGRPRPLAFDRLKVLIMMISLQNIVILDAQCLLMLMGSKFLIKMTMQATKYCSFCLMFSGLIIFIKNFDLINIRSPRAPKITMFCSKVTMTKILSYQKQEALAAHFAFTSFSTRSFSTYLAIPFLHLIYILLQLIILKTILA